MEGMFKREALNGRSLLIYLPVSYGEQGRRFPVVYVHDEGSVMKQSLNYLEHLMMTGELPELIFVGIHSPDRNHEYTPWSAAGVKKGLPDFGGGGAEYLKELVQGIKPFIDTHYLTLPRKEHTGIAGCSLGGLISLYAAYLYPDVFGKIGLLSASFWYEGLLEYMQTHEIAGAKQRIYMYAGGLEGLYKSNIQKDMAQKTREAYVLLLEKGLDSDTIKFDTDPAGTHDSMFFSLRFPEALRWFFGGQPI